MRNFTLHLDTQEYAIIQLTSPCFGGSSLAADILKFKIKEIGKNSISLLATTTSIKNILKHAAHSPGHKHQKELEITALSPISSDTVAFDLLAEVRQHLSKHHLHQGTLQCPTGSASSLWHKTTHRCWNQPRGWVPAGTSKMIFRPKGNERGVFGKTLCVETFQMLVALL